MNSPTAPVIEKLNPATGQPLGQFPMAEPEAIAETVHLARAAQADWKNTSLSQRARLLESVLDLFYQNRQALAETVSQETGKPIADALESDVGISLSSLRYYADLGPKRLHSKRLGNDLISLITGRAHWETYHPRGVIAIISPWNYPLAIPVSGIGTALMAGNAVVLKPSELTPGTGQALVDLFREALSVSGHSPNLVGLLQGDGAIGSALLNQDIDGVIFTGSAPAGRKVQAIAAERGYWCSLELGGSDAMLVLPGSDLEKVASYALWGRYTNAGQACAGVKRLFVPAQDEQALLDHLKDKISRLNVGPPTDPANHVGPLISEKQLQLLESQVQDALAQGASLLAGGERLPGPGWFYRPTLLSHVSSQCRVLREEVFGPVLPVIPYQSVDEAVKQINASAYGLTASVFGPPAQAKALAGKLECGTVVVNDVGPSNYAMLCAPWGGWKASGTGVSHGERALLELCQVQILSENRFYALPIVGKPMWHFGHDHRLLPARSETVLAFSARHTSIYHPSRWLPFWRNRAKTRL